MKQILILEDLKDAQRWLTDAVWRAWPDAQISCHATLQGALTALQQQVPQLCLVDLQLPDGSGVDFIRQCRQQHPDAQRVVATMYADDLHLGVPPLSPQIAQRMLGYFQQVPLEMAEEARKRDLPEADCAGLLSAREQEFLLVIGNGYKTAEAADMLGVSYHTAAKHIKNIYAKLGISSRAQAVQEAIRMGLIN